VHYRDARTGVELDVKRNGTDALISRDPDAREPPEPAHRQVVDRATRSRKLPSDAEQPLPAVNLYGVAGTGTAFLDQLDQVLKSELLQGPHRTRSRHCQPVLRPEPSPGAAVLTSITRIGRLE
jgi:hypothetical protein